MGPVIPGPFPQVFCTKVGSKVPGEMYIVGAHMDGIGYGEAANDDGSGTALVMELARIFSSPDVVTERTIRFALWNGEEGGLRGARAYVAQRQALQGKRTRRFRPVSRTEVARHDPARHDDVGSRRAGRRRQDEPLAAARSRRQHRVPGELEDGRRVAEARLVFKQANERYATDYPANVGKSHAEHRLGAVPGHRRGHQPARERAARPHRLRLGSELAPGDRRLRDLHRQGFQARSERRADDAGGDCATDGGDVSRNESRDEGRR